MSVKRGGATGWRICYNSLWEEREPLFLLVSRPERGGVY